MKKTVRAVISGILFLPPVLAAAGPHKPVWSWTSEERIAARTAHFARPGLGPATEAASLSVGHALVIDGRTSPELLLPSELFNEVLQGLSDDPAMRDVKRGMLDPGIIAY